MIKFLQDLKARFIEMDRFVVEGIETERANRDWYY